MSAARGRRSTNFVRCAMLVSCVLLVANIYQWSTTCYSGDDSDEVLYSSQHWRAADADQRLNVTSSRMTSLYDVICRPITCDLNDADTRLTCCLHDNEVYVPFDIVERYFEVYGRLTTSNETNGKEQFIMRMSLSNVHQPSDKYSPTGVYMSFQHYEVERRTHLKCISGIEVPECPLNCTAEVPISSQWSSGGYYYPTQIAQYGLSHYSKYIAAQRRFDIVPPSTTTLTDATIVNDDDDDDDDDGRRRMTDARRLQKPTIRSSSCLRRVYDATRRRYVYWFKTPHVLDGDAATVSFDDPSFVGEFLSLDLRLSANSSVTVTVETAAPDVRTFHVVYVCTEHILSTAAETGGNVIYYGIGPASGRRHWSTITRDLDVDVLKGSTKPTRRRPSSAYARLRRKEFMRNQTDRKIGKPDRKSKRGERKRRGTGEKEAGWTTKDQKKYHEEDEVTPTAVVRRVVSVQLRGSGYFDNLTLSPVAPHLRMFLRSADWFVRHQDDRSGWPVPVERRIADGRLRLAPGWYSAMAQGQALSVLTRAFALTADLKYLEAARRATAIFDVPSVDGGVLTSLFDLPWYEEYPTVPGTFVLNGFIYALVGLYDLRSAVAEGRAKRWEDRNAERLYAAGVESLHRLLPLYDTGTGSLYDLRHVTLSDGGQQAPNRARSDYHVTHVIQLLLMATIDDDDVISSTAERWRGYLEGRWAPRLSNTVESLHSS